MLIICLETLQHTACVIKCEAWSVSMDSAMATEAVNRVKNDGLYFVSLSSGQGGGLGELCLDFLGHRGVSSTLNWSLSLFGFALATHSFYLQVINNSLYLRGLKDLHGLDEGTLEERTWDTRHGHKGQNPPFIMTTVEDSRRSLCSSRFFSQSRTVLPEQNYQHHCWMYSAVLFQSWTACTEQNYS